MSDGGTDKEHRYYCVVEEKFSYLRDLSFKLPVQFELADNEFSFSSRSSKTFPGVIWILSDAYLKQHKDRIANWFLKHAQYYPKIMVISDQESAPESYKPIPDDLIILTMPEKIQAHHMVRAIETKLRYIGHEFEQIRLKSKLALSYQEIRRLTMVGQALATERDFDKLIELILLRARELVSADGGSIYLTEPSVSGDRFEYLRFKKSAMLLEANEFLLPINQKSIAGYVALTGEPLIIEDVHNLPADAGYSYNSEYDRTHNYYTKSMMVIPMKNHRNEVTGVIQLINRKRSFHKKLTLEELKSDEVIRFTKKDYELVSAMAGQAAVAIENNLLIQEIRKLFEGFVMASVTAIEQRDPTTSGHSFRVADYSVHMALAVDAANSGEFSTVRFAPAQIQELRYASLLHDFGKVGVRENVLVKAKKLYPAQLQLIEWRFHYLRKSIEADVMRKRGDSLRGAPSSEWAKIELEIEQELTQRQAEAEAMFGAILSANEPSVLEEGSFEFLKKIAEQQIHLKDTSSNLISHDELLSLSIRRGTLDSKERTEIESHVIHTYNFLKKIPWTKDLRSVPDIAYGHHEKLDGTGYPLKLGEPQISLQTRMMTIADIYDALTAWDRPYKKAIPPEKALDILQMESKDHHIDPRLLKVFIEAEVYRRIDLIRQAEEPI